MKNWLLAMNVTLSPAIEHERNLDFEKYILRKPSKVVDRRHTTIASNAVNRPTQLNAPNHPGESNAVNGSAQSQAPNQPTQSIAAMRPPPKTLKKPKKILFGARGRRRSVLFIGLRANLDGNHRAEPAVQLPAQGMEADVNDMADMMENLHFSSSDDEL